MKATYEVSWPALYIAAEHLIRYDVDKIVRAFPQKYVWRAYGVPRGGVYASLIFCDVANRYFSNRSLKLQFQVTEDIKEADFVIDDIIDSGNTKLRFERYQMSKGQYFFALLNPQESEKSKYWYVFPWEKEKNEQGPEDNIVRILEYIGDDPSREGLKETPKRVVKSYEEIFAGYKQNPADVMKVFSDGSCDEMVLLKDIEFYSVCEHHMQPFFGKAHIAYLPDQKVIGVSKLARVLDIYSRRLQIQERLTQQVTQALMEHLKPKGAACIIEAKHFCMVCRGVGKQNSTMITSSLEGAFKTDSTTRNEFLSMIRG